MTRLSQLLAIEKGVRQRTEQALAELRHRAQTTSLWNGMVGTYQPKDEEGDQLPPESQDVQVDATEHWRRLQETFTRFLDVVTTKEVTNLRTHADVVVDGEVVLPDMPSPALLFLARQLEEIRKAVAAIPILDPAVQWHYNEEQAVWESTPVQTTRSRKIPRNHVRYEATKEHPAQVDVFTEDTIVGTWTRRSLSGGISATHKAAMLARVDALRDAVISAREEANNVEVIDIAVGRKIFDFIYR